MQSNKFQKPRWYSAVALLSGLASFITAMYFYNNTEVWLSLFFLAFGLLLVITCFEMFFSNLQLSNESLKLQSNFRKTNISRDEILKVSWEKGCGAYIKLNNGKTIIIPNFNSSPIGLSNTIRSWLNESKY